MNSEGSFDSLVDGLFPAPHSDNPWGGQWYGNLDGTAQTLEIEFPVVRMVNRVAVYSVRADNPNCDLLDFDLQYEKDGMGNVEEGPDWSFPALSAIICAGRRGL
jgi:hypothetical protein